MSYQRLFLASVSVIVSDTASETIIGVSHFEAGATAHIADTLENLGFAPAQIGRILDRVRVSEMKSQPLGCTLRLRGELTHLFGRPA